MSFFYCKLDFSIWSSMSFALKDIFTLKLSFSNLNFSFFSFKFTVFNLTVKRWNSSIGTSSNSVYSKDTLLILDDVPFDVKRLQFIVDQSFAGFINNTQCYGQHTVSVKMRELFIEKIPPIPTSMLFGVESIKFLIELLFTVSVHKTRARSNLVNCQF